MTLLQRLRLAWRVLWYRGPWLPRYDFPDDPTLFDYPVDILPSFPAPGRNQDVHFVQTAYPMLNLIPRRPVPTASVSDWTLFALKEHEGATHA